MWFYGNEPTALTILTQAINGIQSADFSKCCTVCGENKSVKRCAPCKKVGYCSIDCQKIHWSTHKKHCKRLAEEYKQELAEQEEMRKRDEERRAKEEEEKQRKEKDDTAHEDTEHDNDLKENGVENFKSDDSPSTDSKVEGDDSPSTDSKIEGDDSPSTDSK
ncbi:hypothetical protein QZH41_017437, partial [Actinostola sp. cb2023]